MNQSDGSPRTPWLYGFAALLLTGFVSTSVLSLMRSEYPAIGSASLIGFSLALTPLLVVGLRLCRGKCQTFCLGALAPALIAFRTTISTLESLFKNLPPTWSPALSDFDEERLIEANRILGTAVLVGVGLGYFCIAVVWLAERLRQAGVRPTPQFSLKTVFVVTTIAGFAASAAARISPANQMQFYVVAFCAGCIAIVAIGLYVAVLMIPPIQVRAVGRRSARSERRPNEP